MKKYLIFYFLITCCLNIYAQDVYIVSAVKGTVTNVTGKKIVVGEKLKLADKLVFTSKTSLLVLAHPAFGRVVVNPNSNKTITPKNNLFTVLLKDILPPQQVSIRMAEKSTPPKPQAGNKADTLLIPKPKGDY